MGSKHSQLVLKGFFGLFLSIAIIGMIENSLWAGEKEDMEAMQKALNQEILDKPFYPGDKAAVDAYLDAAIKKGVKPIETTPPGWAPGWTCNNLTYSIGAYRNCLYYHRYYGRYYPY